jgi:hypothetical protein
MLQMALALADATTHGGLEPVKQKEYNYNIGVVYFGRKVFRGSKAKKMTLT